MGARFDSALMDPPAPQPLADVALLGTVRAWCEAGAFPRLATPLAVASIAPHAGLDGVACALDGSHELARLGRLRGLAWRLQLLLAERLPGRAPRAADPWDCGWWRSGALAVAKAFRPRRATLLLVRPADAAQAEALLAALQGQSTHYARPLRVLVVAPGATEGRPQPRPGFPRA